MEYRELTRRRAIQGACAVIAGGAGLWTAGSRADAASRGSLAGGPGAAQAEAAVVAAASTQQYWTYVSRPDLHPPVVAVTGDTIPPGRRSRYLFAMLHNYPQLPPSPGQPQQGRMIMDWTGEVVWFAAPGMPNDNMSVQTYQGKPVLTWWAGQGQQVESQFVTTGSYTIADTAYTPIATVNAVGDGYAADVHDFVLTPRGTAYVTVGRMTTADLTAIGGPANGQLLDSLIQEIDIATGDLLFEWDALTRLPMDETYWTYSPSSLTDPYHLNSIAIAPDGDLIVSARHMWAVYKISRASGEIVWRLCGKKSDFAMGPGAGFAWQHDVRLRRDDVLSVFDNASYNGTLAAEPQSRAIFLELDTRSMRASLIREYTKPGGILAGNQGSVQLLNGDRVLVSWGDQPYFTEFSPDGQVLMTAQYPIIGGPRDVVMETYRTLSFDWTGRPADNPAAAARPGANGSAVVYASWNGATEVAWWVVLAGEHPTSLASAGARRRAGFETGIPVGNGGPYFVAVAVDARGHELGRSDPVMLSTSADVAS
jgi:hypothetical protein